LKAASAKMAARILSANVGHTVISAAKPAGI